jgi:hypothetical protein
MGNPFGVKLPNVHRTPGCTRGYHWGQPFGLFVFICKATWVKLAIGFKNKAQTGNWGKI